LVLFANRAEAIEQHLEPIGQATLARADTAAGDIAADLASGIDDAEAGGAQAGVDAKNANGRLPNKGETCLVPKRRLGLAVLCWQLYRPPPQTLVNSRVRGVCHSPFGAGRAAAGKLL
jgi:hypothetical protein